MKTINLILHVTMVLLFCSTLAAAQTKIPYSPQQRQQRGEELESQLNVTESSAARRELAMIYAVIAGMDDPQKETTKKAQSYLEQATKSLPKDYELMAAYGSVLTMLARFETKTAKQLHYVKMGFRKMDRAIKKDPKNIGALLQRANNSLGLPVFLKRTHFAKKDFQQVLNLVGDSNGPAFKAMILFNLGLACDLLKDSKQAQTYWNQSAEMKAPFWSEKALAKLNQ